MINFQFLGQVLPKSRGMSLKGPSAVQYKDPDFTLTMVLTITDGAVRVDCSTSRDIDFAVEGYAVYKEAIEFSKAAVDLGTFASGIAFTLVLDRFVEPDGQVKELGIDAPPVMGLCTFLKIGEEGSFASALNVVLGDRHIIWAVRDLAECIELPNKTPINCARAVETIRHLIAPNTVDRKRGWKILRTELNISEEAIRVITDNSTSWRHGNRVLIDGKTSQKIKINAWTIMNRFLEHKKRGVGPLPLDVFPML